jgi:dCTP deaminase
LSLITYSGLVELVERGVIEGVDPSRINAASIDVTLGDVVWIEDASHGGTVDLARKFVPNMVRVEMSLDGFELQPGEFCLAQTREIFNLPDDIAFEFKLKSSLARAGLNHLMAGYADPGWHGSVLTLEYHNVTQYHRLLIRPGMPCGQIVLFRGDPVPEHASYRARGQYNLNREAQPSKGVR